MELETIASLLFNWLCNDCEAVENMLIGWEIFVVLQKKGNYELSASSLTLISKLSALIQFMNSCMCFFKVWCVEGG